MKCEIVLLEMKHLVEMGEGDMEQNQARLQGKAYAFLVDGKVEAAGGIALLWKGVGKAWTVMTERCHESGLLMRRIHQAVSIMFPKVREIMELERVEAEALAGAPCKWLERLGFKLEGAMPKYRSGETYFRFGWVR